MALLVPKTMHGRYSRRRAPVQGHRYYHEPSNWTKKKEAEILEAASSLDQADSSTGKCLRTDSYALENGFTGFRTKYRWAGLHPAAL